VLRLNGLTVKILPKYFKIGPLGDLGLRRRMNSYVRFSQDWKQLQIAALSFV
jgi:hypothetical protein